MSDPQPPYGHPGPPPPVPPYRPATPASTAPVPPYAASTAPVPPYAASTAPVPPYAASTAPVPPYAASAPPYAAPYVPAQHPQFAGAVTYSSPASRTLGIVAFVLALTALVVTPLLAGVAAFRVGLGTAARPELTAGTTWDWSVLSPVRDWALLGEIAFWAGTVLGIWALIQGVIAIVKRQGRGLGIAAVVIAVIAPGVFVFVAWIALVMGLASGSTVGS